MLRPATLDRVENGGSGNKRDQPTTLARDPPAAVLEQSNGLERSSSMAERRPTLTASRAGVQSTVGAESLQRGRTKESAKQEKRKPFIRPQLENGNGLSSS
jgi:hypothetical protein